MFEVCFEDKKKFKIFDFLGINFNELVMIIEELFNFNILFLKDCINLEVFLNIKKFIKFDVIDVLGCSKLYKIEGLFEDMFYLCEVNFFGIKVKILELLKEIKIICLKYIILVDGRCFEGEEWSKIRDEIESKRFDEVMFLSEEIREEV